jgi:hypothetical protein
MRVLLRLPLSLSLSATPFSLKAQRGLHQHLAPIHLGRAPTVVAHSALWWIGVVVLEFMPLACLPGFIAYWKKKKHRRTILLMGIFLGWFLPVWFYLLYRSLRYEFPIHQQNGVQPPASRQDQKATTHHLDL